MASGGSGGVSVPALWSEVNRYGQNGDFTRALKTVNKILQINKDDVTALHCKVVCLIQNGSFKEALNVINTHTKVFANNSLSFEKAYCEYRLNRIENALKTIESANQQTDKLKELYGQVLYRLERYDECLAVYRDLVRNSQDDYDEERKTNLSAVVAAQSNWEKVVPENLGLQEGTHELCYNTACALIGQGQLSQAMRILQKAEDLCRRSFSEDSDGTEEDPQAELAIIHGQMAYILQLQGRTEEALQLYNQIIKLKPTDVALLAVIANNIITINKDQNVFDSKKKVKLTNAEGVEFKLSKKQLQAIEFNKALLAMYTNQAEQCRKISASLQSQSPERLLPVLIQAAQLCREKQHTKAIELLQDYSDQHPENAAEIKLTMAQLKISQGNISKACLILRSIEELKHKPGMVSALVTMYSHEEDIDSAIEVFTQAIQWYQNHQPKSPAHLSLIREAANFKLKYGRKKEAISDLEQLWKQNPKDIHTLAQLISAYSLVDPEKAKALSKHLPSSDSMSLKVDVEALENSPGATYVRKKGGKVTGDNQPKEQGQGDLKKKKKKKKGKLPKNYDPKVTPDPERWLPMRERSYYRGRKKGKKKDQIGKGTQGATAGASSELDASKTVSSPPTSPRPGSAATASTSTSNIIPPRHQKPAGAPATKKKQQQKKKKAPKSYSRFGESAARNPLTGERAQNAQGAARGPGVGRGWRSPRGRCTPRGPTSPPALPPQRRPLRPGSRPAAPARGRAGGGKQTRVVGMERGKVKREKGKEPEKGKIQQKGEEKNKKVEKEKIKEKEKGKEEKNKEKNGKEKTEKGKEEKIKAKEKGKEEKIKEKENGKEKKRGKEEKIKEKENGKEEKSKRNEDEKRQERETEKEKEQFKEKEKEDNSALIKFPLAPLEKNKQILVLGLDGAGKTSILHFLALNRVQRSVAPTQGFNAVCISTGDHQMEFLEIGGSEPFRSYWEMYLSKGLLLVFVVDSADHKRLPEAKKYLHQLIGTNPVLPLVVFANKQDLEAAYHITDIHEALALSEVGNDRKMFLFGTQVTENGSEIPSIIQDARDLIAHLAADMSDQA
ncbi:hypothetical protein AB1E19_004936 [Capra hircus]